MNVMKVKKSKVYVPRLLVLPLLSVLLLTSCARHSAAWPQLLEAEKLLDADLSAAAALIDSIDGTPLQGEDAVLYAILKTQADYKRYLPLISDSLPRLATAYYGTPYRKNYRAAMAWYSLGCYYTEHHADGAAIEVYLKAKELFPDTTSRYHALCSQNIGKHLYLHNKPQEAIPYLEAFRKHPACTADSSLISNADYCLGVAYLRNCEFDKAEKAFYAVLGNRHASENDALNVVFQLSKLLYHDHDNYGAALAFIDKYIADCHSAYQTGSLWSMKGNIYYQYNEMDSALCYYKRALQETNDLYARCEAYKHLLNLAPLMNESDSIPYYTEQYTSLLSEIYERERETEIIEANSRHDMEMMLHRRKDIMIVGCTFLSGILLIVVFCRLGRNRKGTSLASNHDNETQPSSSASRQELVDQCCSVFSQTSAASFLRSDFRLEDKLSSDKRNTVEQALKESFADVENALRNECAGITPDDALLCMYMLLGLSSKEIQAYSRFSAGSVASRKTRLRKKLTPEWRSAIFRLDE